MARLAGKTAVITGAGSGLGRAMAMRFVAEGAAVLVADIDEAGGQATVAAIGTEYATRVAFRRVDVTNEDQCAASMAEAVTRWGRLDVLVANAGIGVAGTIARLAREDFEQVLAVNLTGVFLCAKHAFQAMQGSGGGVILATASVAGLRGTPGLGAYGASKAGVVQLVKTLALEGARHSIRANALCPVWTQTPMVDAFVASGRGTPEETRARLVGGIPLGRLGDPTDVAAAAVYLASDEAAFITGVAFPVDGGSLA
jgi:NAD(P)-dependent dehydrogenase (short-subunit alcohol dehydrogenase family)